MDILKKAEKFARKEYVKNDPKHQWSHVQAVMHRALEIAASLQDVDVELLKLAVFFHDIDYHSEPTPEENYMKHVDNSVKVAEGWLREHNFPEHRIQKIKRIILDHSTPHRNKIGDAQLIEGKIIYDADKSIAILSKERFDKYSPKLYFEISKELAKKQIKS